MASVVSEVGVLYQLSEKVKTLSIVRLSFADLIQIALLDMLWSFAHVAIRKQLLSP